MNIEQSITAILDQQGNIMGTGFLAKENLVITAAHVLSNNGYSPQQQVKIRFEKDKSLHLATISSEWWSAEDEKDIAVLILDTNLDTIQPLRLTSANKSKGNDFSTFGYATVTGIQGIAATGQIVAILEDGNIIQLRSQELDHGMSGAPVVDENQQVVIGIISKGKDRIEEDGSQRNLATTFAISGDSIFLICPEVRPVDKDRYYHLKDAQSLAKLVYELLGENFVHPYECDESRANMISMWDEHLMKYFESSKDAFLDGKEIIASKLIKGFQPDLIFAEVQTILSELKELKRICRDKNQSVKIYQANIRRRVGHIKELIDQQLEG